MSKKQFKLRKSEFASYNSSILLQQCKSIVLKKVKTKVYKLNYTRKSKVDSWILKSKEYHNTYEQYALYNKHGLVKISNDYENIYRTFQNMMENELSKRKDQYKQQWMTALDKYYADCENLKVKLTKDRK